MCFWKPSGPTFWPAPGTAPGNVWKCVSGSLLGVHYGLRLEMLENVFRSLLGLQSGLRLEAIENVYLEAVWAHILACAWKCLKLCFWKLSGPTLWLVFGSG